MNTTTKGQNLTSTFHRGYLSRFLSLIVLAILVGAVAAPQAFARRRPPPPPPPPPDPVEESGGTTAQFTGPNSIWDIAPRLCEDVLEPPNTAGSGRMSCLAGNLWPAMKFTTSALTLTASKKSLSICNSLQNHGDFNSLPARIPASYEYGWTDACTDGSCGVVVDLTFNDSTTPVGWLSTATGGKSDWVDIRVSGTLEGVGPDDGNPFAGDRELEVDTIVMTWRKPGSTTTLAVCTFFANNTVFTSLTAAE